LNKVAADKIWPPIVGVTHNDDVLRPDTMLVEWIFEQPEPVRSMIVHVCNIHTPTHTHAHTHTSTQQHACIHTTTHAHTDARTHTHTHNHTTPEQRRAAGISYMLL